MAISCASSRMCRGQVAALPHACAPVTCPLCPFKIFKSNCHARELLLAHLHRHHTAEARCGPFIASCGLHWRPLPKRRPHRHITPTRQARAEARARQAQSPRAPHCVASRRPPPNARRPPRHSGRTPGRARPHPVTAPTGARAVHRHVAHAAPGGDSAIAQKADKLARARIAPTAHRHRSPTRRPHRSKHRRDAAGSPQLHGRLRPSRSRETQHDSSRARRLVRRQVRGPVHRSDAPAGALECRNPSHAGHARGRSPHWDRRAR